MPFPLNKQPPVHMPITYGLVGINKPGAGAVREADLEEEEDEEEEEGVGEEQRAACCSLCSAELKVSHYACLCSQAPLSFSSLAVHKPYCKRWKLGGSWERGYMRHAG